MLESIRNAVLKTVELEILESKTVTNKTESYVTFKIEDKSFDEEKVKEIYEQVAFYLPYLPTINLPKIQSEIRKILHSDL